MFIDVLESRELFTADISISATNLMFSGPKNKTTALQSVTITNNGNTALKIAKGGIAVGGNDSAKFQLSSLPTLPKSIPAGGKVTFKVGFKPNAAGVKSAAVIIKSNDPDMPAVSISLRGLGANGLYDTNEPSLQRVFNAFQIPLSAGDLDMTTARIDSLAPNDVIDMQTMTKAGEGPVTFEMLAAYTGAANPGGRFGWYTPTHTEDANILTELFTLPSTEVQRLNPRTTGVTSFDPGQAEFALYSSWPTQSYDKVFSENALNIWEPTETARDKYRFYPLENPDGSEVANAYVVAIEEARNNDYQDAVMIIRNVQKYIAPPLPPVEPPVEPPVTPPTDPTTPPVNPDSVGGDVLGLT